MRDRQHRARARECVVSCYCVREKACVKKSNGDGASDVSVSCAKQASWSGVLDKLLQEIVATDDADWPHHARRPEASGTQASLTTTVRITTLGRAARVALWDMLITALWSRRKPRFH